MFATNCYRYMTCNPESVDALFGTYGEMLGISRTAVMHANEEPVDAESNAWETESFCTENSFVQMFVYQNPLYTIGKTVCSAATGGSCGDSDMVSTRQQVRPEPAEKEWLMYCSTPALREHPEDIEKLHRWPIWRIALVSSVTTIESILNNLAEVGNVLIATLKLLTRIAGLK